MKRIKTRVLALLLSCCLVIVGAVGSYQTAQAAEIVAGGAIVGTLEEILLSFGIFLLPSAMADQAQSSDWWYSEDGNAALKPYYDDLASEYEKERFKVINGGGGDPQPSPTPDAGTTPEPGVTPVPGEIPTFDELVAPALAGGAISWASGAWDTMAKAVGNLWDKFVNNKTVVQNDYIPDWDSDYFVTTSGNYKQVGKAVSFCPLGGDNPYGVAYDYFTIYVSENATSLKIKKGNYHDEFIDDLGKIYVTRFSVYHYNSGKTETKKCNNQNFLRLYSPVIGDGYGYSFSSDLPVYVDDSLEPLNRNDAKENIWVHPDLQETYQNNGKLEYPQQAPQPLQYPSAENLADLAKKLNPEINPDYSPEIAPNYVQELIQKLQQNPSVNPDPNPNPNPEPGTNPQPTLKPNPTDTPDQPENPEDEVKPYTADLTKVFPFCIPFDLIHLFKVLDAEPEAPVFKIPIELKVDNPFNGKSIVDYEDTIVIDLSDYEQPIKVIRIFEVIFFLIGLMLITRSHMIKG